MICVIEAIVAQNSQKSQAGETEQMAVIPAECGLYHFVEFLERECVRHQHTPPHGWLGDAFGLNVELVGPSVFKCFCPFAKLMFFCRNRKFLGILW